jgi:hypothetical protein
MAAGLPILSTELDFVASLVRLHDLGAVFSFTGQPSLAKATSLFIEDKVRLRKCAHRAREFFRCEFNWEVVSKSFYDELDSLVRSDCVADVTPLDFSWIGTGRPMRRSVRPEFPPIPSIGTPPVVHAESFLLRIFGLFPKNWRHRIRRHLPERLITEIMARLT